MQTIRHGLVLQKRSDAKSLGWCLTRYGPMDCSSPDSSVLGILPGKNTGVGCHALLQGIFLTQGLTHVSCGCCIAGGFFTAEPLGTPKGSDDPIQIPKRIKAHIEGKETVSSVPEDLYDFFNKNTSISFQGEKAVGISLQKWFCNEANPADGNQRERPQRHRHSWSRTL